MRVTGHPENGSVVLSMWRGDQCVATHHVAAVDVPELIKLLASALVEPAQQRRPTAS